jgi:DNA end-binding protein Ku
MMALRSVWKGSLRFSLVSVPVEAFTAAETGDGEIRFHQLHEKCHSRIRYKKTCPIHGEVPNDEIVSGHEYAKDKYVVFEPGELSKLRPEGDRSISIDTFVNPDEIDPIYFDGRTCYLVPDSAAAEKPYAVLCQAMTKLARYGLAAVILHGKEELVLVRPLDGLLTMTMLHYASQVRGPGVIKDELPKVSVNPREVKLAQQLIEASTDENFDFSKYEDQHTAELRNLIEAKVKGKEIVAPPAESEEEVPIINLMDALRKSVQQTKRPAMRTKASKARKTLASHLSKSAGSQRRRKTS